jgi:hypothetical protein
LLRNKTNEKKQISFFSQKADIDYKRFFIVGEIVIGVRFVSLFLQSLITTVLNTHEKNVSLALFKKEKLVPSCFFPSLGE